MYGLDRVPGKSLITSKAMIQQTVDFAITL
ncbi:hypothetical protein FH603_5120 [Spirosoma sp. LMG 31447]|uniref:Uncharacterized protein n=1 Tax=Spirosoma utsteinense TaxID=2585773 RepID=A0ABR6WEZ8_9BACT|nr:hypothetical protein [Spirosoma utsteinense]